MRREPAGFSLGWLCSPNARASAHLVIGRDGSITQLVDFDKVAWHAGQSQWEGRTGLNSYAIGIELDNAGRLSRRDSLWQAWFGGSYETNEVLEAIHKHEQSVSGWHIFPPKQIEAALEVASLLFDTYHLLDVVGHDDIAPGRKSDPGPAFPMHSFRARLLGREESTPLVLKTTADALNIRSGPGTQYAAIPGSPLPNGTVVEIIRNQGNWSYISVRGTVNGVSDMEGWVHRAYLARVEFATKQVPEPYDYLAPDNSEIRLLLQMSGGGLAHCTLPIDRTSQAHTHQTVDEIWYVIEGQGQVWRKQGKKEEVVPVAPGACVTIPTGTHFQFRNTGQQPLRFVIATIPPWPGPQEAVRVRDHWPLDDQ